MKEIILIGGGGHCKSCIDVIEQQGEFAIKGLVDQSDLLGERLLGYRYIGTDEDLPELAKKVPFALVTVGQIRTADLRIKLTQLALNAGFKLPVIVSPKAYVSDYARLGQGSIVMHQALVNAGAVIGSHTIINSQALVEHDAQIGDFCHISTAAKINGGTQVGREVFIGSGAVTKEYAEIADKSFIKAGSIVK